jgi:hypothetical protein
LALRRAPNEPASPKSQIIKPDARGKATRWQGYVAREGFGKTRTRNHISATNPVSGKIQINQRLFCLRAEKFPFFGQIDEKDFLLKSDILIPLKTISNEV